MGRMIVWNEKGEQVHAFQDVLEGGINALMLHRHVMFYLFVFEWVC